MEKETCLGKKVYHRISEKSNKKISHLLQGQNKGFWRLLALLGCNSIWETAYITKRLLQCMWWHWKSQRKKKKTMQLKKGTFCSPKLLCGNVTSLHIMTQEPCYSRSNIFLKRHIVLTKKREAMSHIKTLIYYHYLISSTILSRLIRSQTFFSSEIVFTR